MSLLTKFQHSKSVEILVWIPIILDCLTNSQASQYSIDLFRVEYGIYSENRILQDLYYWCSLFSWREETCTLARHTGWTATGPPQNSPQSSIASVEDVLGAEVVETIPSRSMRPLAGRRGSSQEQEHLLRQLSRWKASRQIPERSRKTSFNTQA